MNKDNVIYGVVGLIVGLVVGFVFANSVNRTPDKAPTATAATTATGSNPALPPDHPPLGTSANMAQGAPMPDITEAIDKATAEPKNYEAQMTAGDLYYQIGRFEDSVKFYEAANKLKPGEAEPMIKLGNALFDAEKYEEAEKPYSLALQKEPKNVNVRTDLGLTFFLREPRDIDRAVKEYQASLAIDPNHEVTLQNLAIAYSETNDVPNLAATVDRLKKINPNNPVVLKAAEMP